MVEPLLGSFEYPKIILVIESLPWTLGVGSKCLFVDGELALLSPSPFFYLAHHDENNLASHFCLIDPMDPTVAQILSRL